MKVSALALLALATTSPSSAFSPSPLFRVQRRSAVKRLSNGGMDAYDAAMKQAYAQQAPTAPAPAPAPVTPEPASSDEPINWGAASAAAAAPPAASEPINWGAAATAAPAASAAVAAVPVAPAPPAAPAPAPAAGGGGGAASAESAIATLSASQAASVDKIASAIGPDLERKPDLSWTAGSVDGSTATIDGREAPGANGNVAWLANVQVEGKMSSLTIFNGPLTDVPHLLSRAVILRGESIRFTLDFRPRAYGAYEMRDADGNYPGPDVLGRDAFTYSGNRNDFDSKFGNDEVVAFVEGVKEALVGAVANDATPGELDSLTRGPLYMDVTCPLNDGNVATICNARSQAADYWLSWAMDGGHAHRPGAPVNSQYVYDSKYKINAYGALLEEYKEMFGADGVKLAAAESGPLDEAYVGGGS